MRLLYQDEQQRFALTSDDYDPPPYAILSHTWSTNQEADEVSYQDIIDGTSLEKDGYEKLKFIAGRAKEDNLKYFWVDTCCIGPTEAERSTAIRSMYRWYEQSAVCYVYLTDVPFLKRSADGRSAWQDAFRSCRWLTRGWTLQELLAPKRVDFYAREHCMGTKGDLAQLIQECAGIDANVLRGKAIADYPLSVRWEWAVKRQTSRPEDHAYSLMGLCETTMTPHYGEGGEEAQKRLKRKILKRHGENALDRPSPLIDRTMSHNTCVDVSELREHKLKLLEFKVMDSRKEGIKSPQFKTCAWILKHSTYLSWWSQNETREHNGFFWIKGKPGTGKSVLMKFIDYHVHKTKRSQDIIISFYFHARGEMLEKSLTGMYRSLLVQLLRADPDLQAVLDTTRAADWESVPSIEELQRLFCSAAMQLSNRRFFCLIDALDECLAHDVQRMINFFQELGQKAGNEGIAIHVCFASRYYPFLTIETGLQLELDHADEHESDIRQYVRSRKFQVGASGRMEKIPTEIQDEIVDRANKVFLWVVLVVDILNEEYKDGRMHAVKQRLKELPDGLSELFKSIVERDKKHMGDFFLCLKWLLYAKRPLGLREFYYAMMSGIPGQDLRWHESCKEDMMHSYLLTSSKGLAELTRGARPRVQFIHESVRDFLLSEEASEYFKDDHHAGRCKSHDLLKQYCMRAIRSDVSDVIQKNDLNLDACGFLSTLLPKELRAELTSRYPFLEYATQHVFFHADQAAPDVAQWDFINILFKADLDDWIWNANLLQRYGKSLLSGPPDLYYIFAEDNYANLIKILNDHQYMPPSESKHRYISPLFAAFANKSIDACRVLLGPGNAIETEKIIQDVIVANHKSRTHYDYSPSKRSSRDDQGLEWALHQGHVGLSLYLVPSASEEACHKATSAATQRRDFGVLERLLEYCPNLDVTALFREALLTDVRKSNLEFVRLLLRLGADVSAIYHEDGTVLHVATSNSWLEGVQILLDHGADVNAAIHYKTGTALQVAASQGWLEGVRLLLDRGADVNARIGPYDTALQAAASQGWFEVVQLLLDRGANVNVRGGCYGNALHAAAWRGWREVVQLLLDRGADVNAQAGPFGTALRAAKSHGRFRIFQLLLDNGAYSW